MGKLPHIQSYFCVFDWNSLVLHPHHKLKFDQTYIFVDIDILDSETCSTVVSIFFYVAVHL